MGCKMKNILLLILLLPVLALSQFSEEKISVSNDRNWEGGTVGNWITHGADTFHVVTDTVHNGTYAMKSVVPDPNTGYGIRLYLVDHAGTILNDVPFRLSAWTSHYKGSDHGARLSIYTTEDGGQPQNFNIVTDTWTYIFYDYKIIQLWRVG